MPRDVARLVVERLHAVNAKHHRQRVAVTPTARRLRMERIQQCVAPRLAPRASGSLLADILKDELTALSRVLVFKPCTKHRANRVAVLMAGEGRCPIRRGDALRNKSQGASAAGPQNVS